MGLAGEGDGQAYRGGAQLAEGRDVRERLTGEGRGLQGGRLTAEGLGLQGRGTACRGKGVREGLTGEVFMIPETKVSTYLVRSSSKEAIDSYTAFRQREGHHIRTSPQPSGNTSLSSRTEHYSPAGGAGQHILH